MKKVEAIIRPEKLPVVRRALEDLGLGGMTITQVAGHGNQRGITQQWKGNTYTIDLLTKTKVELVVDDTVLEKVLMAIKEAAGTGEIGDGKVFVTTVDDVMRVRTGERGASAL
jgi:nitrogen regulatory protein P-II 1